MNDEDLKRLLKQPEVPASLTPQIRDNWRAQLKEQTGHRPAGSRLLLGAVASVGLAFLVLFAVMWQGAPTVVTLAMQDVATDAARLNQAAYRFDEAMRVHLQAQGINPPLPAMEVKMAKYCTLDEARTLHLRIAGALRGEVHLFIYDGHFDVPAWRAERGELATMHWQVIHPRDDLSVLVLRSADMNPRNVERLIQKMFYV